MSDNYKDDVSTGFTSNDENTTVINKIKNAINQYKYVLTPRVATGKIAKSLLFFKTFFAEFLMSLKTSVSMLKLKQIFIV